MSPEALGWYASIWAVLFFTGVGIPPLPEEAGILYAASVAAVQEEVFWWLAWPAAGLGILCADTVLYGVGRAWGPRLFEYRWVRRLVKPERRLRFEKRFHEHGIKILLTARFLPPLRTGLFIVAGALRYSFLRFLLADGIYAVFGVGLFFFVGAGVVQLLHLVQERVGHWTPYAVGALVGAYLLYRYYRHLRQRELRDAAPPVSLPEAPAPGGAAPPGAAPAEACSPLPAPEEVPSLGGGDLHGSLLGRQ